jgi:DNA-3-methyladenine glycosylase
LGIGLENTGERLSGNKIYIADDGFIYPSKEIKASARIGVDYAEEDALLPYRFSVIGNKYVSK